MENRIVNPVYGKSIEFVAEEIRRGTKRSRRQPCWICLQHPSITHEHHLIPVSEMAQLLINHREFNHPISIRTVWLCPNHHAYLHLIEQKNISIEQLEHYGFNEAEVRSYRSLFHIKTMEMTELSEALIK